MDQVFQAWDGILKSPEAFAAVIIFVLTSIGFLINFIIKQYNNKVEISHSLRTRYIGPLGYSPIRKDLVVTITIINLTNKNLYVKKFYFQIKEKNHVLLIVLFLIVKI